DALQAHAGHWFVRATTGLLRRALARLDVTSRSLIALLEPGSCFAGTLAELALAADRSYMLVLPDEPQRTPRLTLHEANFGRYPMVSDQTRLQRRFYADATALGAARATLGRGLDGDEAAA
ncbi:MAG: benzoyl-CoA-dihydrodiol lyase, partial [Candidatus Sumerlaeia bacterium]|nr:benzoyl-CoA-dihydrodiol lyase [Candidatus Sumerlaeia bacterium]